MKTNKLLFLASMLFFTILLNSCGQIESRDLHIEKGIIGKWSISVAPQSKYDIEFTKNGNYNYYYNDVLVTDKMSDFLHQLTYEIVKENEQNRLLIYTKEPKNLIENKLIELDKGKLYQVSFKMVDGISHHIDEYSILGRGNNIESEIEEKNEPKTKIIFPNNFNGLALIAFEEENGSPTHKDSNQVEILNIPSNGLLKTKSKPKPFAYARREVKYLIEKNDGQLEHVELAYGNRVSRELKNKNLDANKLYLINFGFNQIDRPRVNSKLFKSIVKNDVLFLGVGTPNELAQLWDETIQSIQ